MKYRNTPMADTWRRFCRNKAAVLGLIVFAIFLLVAIFADVIVDYQKCLTNTAAYLTPPSAEHLFGTDQLGRDVFARVIHGSRISLSVGVVATMLTTVAGALIGGIVGYYGGRVDDIIMRILDVINCIPSMLLLLSIVTVMGANMVNMIIALTIGTIPGMVRLVRSTVLSVSGMEYIQSAKAYGTSSLRIIIKHVIPNAIGPIIITTAGNLSACILAAAAMSYLGFGVQPPTPEWGIILNDARNFMRTAPHLMIFPGVAILLSAMSVNLMGDGLRDALDPRLKD